MDGKRPALLVHCARGDLDKVKESCQGRGLEEVLQKGLFEACENDHLNIVQYLLTEQNCDPQCRNESGRTPLHVACASGHLNIIQYLLTEQNYDPQCRDETGRTPLHVACANGHLNIVQYLLTEQNCDPQCRDESEWTPLHEACENGHLNIVQYLLTEQNCDPQCRDESEWTPLHVACENGHLNIVQYLLTEQNCDPQSRDESEWTPLHEACANGHLNIVQYLLTVQNCDPQCRDKAGRTPLHLACEYGHLDLVKCLVADPQYVIDCRDHGRSMPIDIAAQCGKWDIVKFLLSEHFKQEQYYNQFYFFCQNKLKWPKDVLQCCIQTAYREGKVDIVCYLVEEEEVNVEVHMLASGSMVQKQIVLLTACEHGQLPVVKYLISEQHCDPEQQNEKGKIPLHVACQYDHLNIVQYLFTEQNCDPRCRDARGQTPLHVAARKGNTNITKFLLSLPSSQVDVQDANGCTPLDLTTSNSVWDLLVKHGADPLPITLAKRLKAVAIQAHPTPPSYIKLYVIGNQGSGKSTLAKAIKDEHIKDDSENVQDVGAHTAGIVLSEFESEELGHVVIYDFAGHREYYASHAAVLENSLSFTAVFLALVDLRDSPSDIALQLHYWVSFIESYRVSAVWHPHVLVIGSHLDECTSPEVRVSTLDETLKTTQMLSLVHITGVIALDCRKPASENMAQVRSHLKNNCTQLRKIRNDLTESHLYKIMKVFLEDVFTSNLGLKLHTLVRIAKKTNLPFMHSQHDVFKVCEDLCNRSYILFLPNLDCIDESWIVVDKQTLLSKINGTLFAPPEFSRHRNISSSTGVVPLSEIATLFNDLDPDLILYCLVHLEFCQLIRDPEILKNLKPTDHSSTELVSESAAICPNSLFVEEKYLFFPSLVSIERPSLVWREQEGFEYHCGWYLHCKHAHQFFTSRFLQVLLLRLAFLFVLPSPPETDEDTSPVKNRECSVWMNGVRWLDMNGIETVVEMLGQQKGVLVVMRCAEGSAKLACVKLRTAIISQVLEAKNEFCNNVVTIESLLEPTDLKKQYPAQNLPDLKHYNLRTIERAILEGKPFVYDQSRTRLTKLEDLLYFESYVHLGEDILSRLFKPTNALKAIPEHFLGDIAEKASSVEHVPPSQLKDAILVRMHEFAKVLKVPPQVVEVYSPARSLLYIFKEGLSRCKEQTYGQLKCRLDKYSILCGRDIDFKVSSMIQTSSV